MAILTKPETNFFSFIIITIALIFSPPDYLSHSADVPSPFYTDNLTFENNVHNCAHQVLIMR